MPRRRFPKPTSPAEPSFIMKVAMQVGVLPEDYVPARWIGPGHRASIDMDILAETGRRLGLHPEGE